MRMWTLLNAELMSCSLCVWFSYLGRRRRGVFQVLTNHGAFSVKPRLPRWLGWIYRTHFLTLTRQRGRLRSSASRQIINGTSIVNVWHLRLGSNFLRCFYACLLRPTASCFNSRSSVATFTSGCSSSTLINRCQLSCSFFALTSTAYSTKHRLSSYFVCLSQNMDR